MRSRRVEACLALVLGASSACLAPDDEAEAPPPEEVAEPATYSIRVTPSSAVLLPNAQLQLKAQVFDPSNNMVFNRRSRPVVVQWTTSDPDIATVDESGLVTVRRSAPVEIKAQLSEADFAMERVPPRAGAASINNSAASSDVNGLQAIFVDPERIAIDLGEPRTLSVTAVDGQGAPTTLDCGGEPTLGFDEAVDATYDGSLGAESIRATGLQKGFSLLTLDCAGYQATPVVIEVKPSVTIPDPSPSTQDSDFGLEPSVALHNEVIHLATYDRKHNKLVYTRFDGVWSSQFLDGEGAYGRHAKILLDPLADDRPLICALEDRGVSCWEQDAEGFWIRDAVDHDVFEADAGYDYPIGGAFAADGTAHVMYFRAVDDALVLASRDVTTGIWTREVLATGADYGAIAVASDGELRVAFRQGGAARYGHRSCTGGGWSLEEIDVENTPPPPVEGEETPAPAGPGTYISLAIGDDDRPQVVYYKAKNLIHAIKNDGQWRTNVIEAVELAGPNFGFALDRRQRPRVSYFDLSEQRLRYAHRRDGRWYVDSPTAVAGVGSHNTIAVDDYDRAQIPYYDENGQEAGYYVEPHYLDYAGVDAVTANPNRANTNECSNIHH